MQEINIRIKDLNYMDFQSADNNSGLKVDEKIHELSICFGRNEGAIRSKLYKLGFLTDWKK